MTCLHLFVDEQSSHALSGTNAHTRDQHLLLSPSCLAKNCADLASTCGAQGMAECDGTAAGVDLGMIQTKVLQTVDGHRSKGLVDLVNIDVILVQVELGEELGNSSGRADAHDARGNASNGGTTELSQDRLVKLDGPGATHEQDSGSFIILAFNHSIERE